MPSTWNPFHPAVFVEPGPHSPRISLVRHDGYPYEEAWDEGGTGWQGLFDITNRYLALVNPRFKLPPQWLADLREEPPSGSPLSVSLHWLREQDPRHSYWVERQGDLDTPSRPKTGPVRDRAAVLLAGLWLSPKKQPLYGGQGLRVIVQTGPAQSQPIPVRITGVASTLPSSKSASEARITSQMLEDLPQRIVRTFALPRGVGLVDIGLRVPDLENVENDPSPIIFAKTATAPGYSGGHYAYDAASYLLTMRVNPKWPEGLEPLARRLLIAAVNADADVFVQDPVSHNGAGHFTRLRPNRSWTVLDPKKVNVPLGDLPPGAPGLVQLVDPDPNTPPDPDFRVTNARLVDPPAPDGATREVPASVTDHVRTNAFAAVNAFYHTGQLFHRLRYYGLPPAAYFRFVARPIDVQYRSSILPGVGDGRTVNAQVRWTLRPDKGATPTKGLIEACFALGDLDSAVGRLPANLPSAGERSPLGVASDPRWCWHECCHILLTAAVGDLELHFAHSAGDAIAAILSDPDSELAKDNGPWRGVTFPWVLIPRRHDRHVRDGWSWTGPLNRREVYFAVPGLSDKRGYWAEQILSSSLFRLYRAIGGDSKRLVGGQPAPARPERQNAADYVVYLIMRTIESLGGAGVTPSTEPGQFVDAMRKVDTVTATVPGPGGYVGGTVHKVVQWAFERQGLYGLPVPGSAVSGPEEVAPVDLHIKDLRPTPDGPYSPVDLLGDLWQADPDFFWVKGPFLWGRKRRIRVRVQNRGIALADDTRVDVWIAPVNDGANPPIPKFPDPTKWQTIGSAIHSVPGRSGQTPGARTFGPFSWTPPAGPPQKYAILAAATCDADRSNIDPTTGHPCVTVASPIELLVGCDNNLGLITIMID
jgi:hypothetical protein